MILWHLWPFYYSRYRDFLGNYFLAKVANNVVFDIRTQYVYKFGAFFLLIITILFLWSLVGQTVRMTQSKVLVLLLQALRVLAAEGF